MSPGSVRTLGVALAAVVLMLGAGPGGKFGGKKPKPAPPLRSDETVGDIANVRARDSIKVEGVGLVVGLSGTGSEAEPSIWRTKLLNVMRKATVPNAEKLLSSKDTSIVLVRATIPVGVGPKDPFDVEVELTPASTTTSLAGGHLIMTDLSVVQIVKGEPLDGGKVAKVGGPILTGSPSEPDNLRVGRILGGAHVKKEIPYNLVLREERKGGWVAALLQRTINLRFYRLDGKSDKDGMADAVTDQSLVLKVPHVYHHNQGRYFQVVERLPMVDTLELRAQRQERWGKELLDPKTAGEACLKLEGIGRNSTVALTKGLESPHPQVRYFAAESLAYLGDPAGVDVLAEAAANRSEFRAFAFAALAALDEPAAQMRLRDLLAHADPKVRYGAFDALRIVDPGDTALGRVRLIRDPEPEAEADDAMAMEIARPRRRGPRQEDPFALYVVDCDGPPMVHFSKTRRCEIVVFGRDSKLLTPAVLGGAGPILLNAGLGDEQIFLSRIATGDPGAPDLRTSCPPDLGAVIREAANLGASYPDIVGILQAADRQKNLPGPLVFDALPAAGADYDQAQLAGVDTAEARKAPGDAKKDDGLKRTSGTTEESDDAPKARKGLLDRLRRR